jgi:hypothetical protein
MSEKLIMACSKVLFKHSPGEAKKNHNNPLPVPGLDSDQISPECDTNVPSHSALNKSLHLNANKKVYILCLKISV